jgi:dsRNA-specific ribonuclease
VSRPEAPPPSSRPTVTADERAAIEEAVGPVPDADLLRALRDARGRTFQRLEFLGDSVLDLTLVTHTVLEPDCPQCQSSRRHVDAGQLATDRRLAEQARRHGLGGWLEWEVSDDRLADVVEGSVAVAWLSGGWAAVVELVAAVVHPLGPRTGPALLGGAVPDVEDAAGERRVGAALLELAAGRAAYRELPDGDEGDLSHRRAELHRTVRVAAYAARTGVVAAAGDADTVSDRVERWLAGALLADGADAALERAAEVLS